MMICNMFHVSDNHKTLAITQKKKHFFYNLQRHLNNQMALSCSSVSQIFVNLCHKIDLSCSTVTIVWFSTLWRSSCHTKRLWTAGRSIHTDTLCWMSEIPRLFVMQTEVWHRPDKKETELPGNGFILKEAHVFILASVSLVWCHSGRSVTDADAFTPLFVKVAPAAQGLKNNQSFTKQLWLIIQPQFDHNISSLSTRWLWLWICTVHNIQLPLCLSDTVWWTAVACVHRAVKTWTSKPFQQHSPHSDNLLTSLSHCGHSFFLAGKHRFSQLIERSLTQYNTKWWVTLIH